MRCLLNALNILQNSKYSQGATSAFAAVFLVMGLGGFYFSFMKVNIKTALVLGLGPWIAALIIIVMTMLTSDYK